MGDKDAKSKEPAPPPSEPMPPTGCVVCGSYAGKLSETAGPARWHAECGNARPDVIKKVKSRA